MGQMRDGIHDGFCSDKHYCEEHCPIRFESEAPIGCTDTDCPIEQQYDDEDKDEIDCTKPNRLIKER